MQTCKNIWRLWCTTFQNNLSEQVEIFSKGHNWKRWWGICSSKEQSRAKTFLNVCISKHLLFPETLERNYFSLYKTPNSVMPFISETFEPLVRLLWFVLAWNKDKAPQLGLLRDSESWQCIRSGLLGPPSNTANRLLWLPSSIRKHPHLSVW